MPAKSEAAISNEIERHYGADNRLRLWRAHVLRGSAWGSVQAGLALIRAGKIREGAAKIQAGFQVAGSEGQADFSGIICGSGRRLELEIKTATGKQREKQKDWQRMIEGAGGLYILARSLEDAKEQLEPHLTTQWGHHETTGG